MLLSRPIGDQQEAHALLRLGQNPLKDAEGSSPPKRTMVGRSGLSAREGEQSAHLRQLRMRERRARQPKHWTSRSARPGCPAAAPMAACSDSLASRRLPKTSAGLATPNALSPRAWTPTGELCTCTSTSEPAAAAAVAAAAP